MKRNRKTEIKKTCQNREVKKRKIGRKGKHYNQGVKKKKKNAGSAVSQVAAAKKKEKKL